MRSGGRRNQTKEKRLATHASRFRRLLRRWGRIWETAALPDQTLIEWSPRLSRTLGRAYPQRMLIRLNASLREPELATILDEVLCHEAAHLAVLILHGRDAAMHGVEWRQLIERAGYLPRTGIYIPELVSPTSSLVRYEHACPVCHAKRFAKRRQPSWRCVACRELGLDGKLIICRRPATSGVRDD